MIKMGYIKNTLGACMLAGMLAFSGNSYAKEPVKPIDPPKTVSVLTGNPYKNDKNFIEWTNIRNLYDHFLSKGVKKKDLFVAMPDNEINNVRQKYLVGDNLEESNSSHLSGQGLEKILAGVSKTVDSNDTLIFYFAGNVKGEESERFIGKDVDVDYLKNALADLDYQKAIIVVDAEDAESFGALKSDRNTVVVSGGKYCQDKFSSFGKSFLFNLSNSFADLNEDGKVTCKESFEASTKKHYNYINSRYGINVLSKGKKIIESKIFLESDSVWDDNIKKRDFDPDNLKDLLEKLSYRHFDVHDFILQKHIVPHIKTPYASGVFYHWKGKEKFIEHNKEIFRKVYDSKEDIKEKMSFDKFLRGLYHSFGREHAAAMCAAFPENFGKDYKPAIMVFDNFFEENGVVTLDDARCLLQDHEHKHAKDVFFGLKYNGKVIDASKLSKTLLRSIMEVRAEEKEFEGANSGNWKNLSEDFIMKSDSDFIWRYTSLSDMIKDSSVSSSDKELIKAQLEELKYEVYQENGEQKVREKTP